MIEMKIKALLRYSYRVIEILLLLSITLGIVLVGIKSHDSAEMLGILLICMGALFVWWFISLPIFIIVEISFIRCLIPPISLYKKVVLSLHILNVVLLFLFYFILPKPDSCDAALMEQHYQIHHDDMHDLVDYVRSSLNDSCWIILEYRNDEVQRFKIGNGYESKTCTGIKNQQELEAILNTAGLSMQELTVIKEKMQEAGIIGIDIDKHSVSRSRWTAGKNILQFRWYGDNIYQYALYDHPVIEDNLPSELYIIYNDSVVFENYGIHSRGFPDKDKFQSLQN